MDLAPLGAVGFVACNRIVDRQTRLFAQSLHYCAIRHCGTAPLSVNVKRR